MWSSGFKGARIYKKRIFQASLGPVSLVPHICCVQVNNFTKQFSFRSVMVLRLQANPTTLSVFGGHHEKEPKSKTERLGQERELKCTWLTLSCRGRESRKRIRKWGKQLLLSKPRPLVVQCQVSSQTRKEELLKYNNSKWNELMNYKSEVCLVITLIYERKRLVTVEKTWEN